VHIWLYLHKYLADSSAAWSRCNSGVYKYVPFEMLSLLLRYAQHVSFLIYYTCYVHIHLRMGHEQKWENILISLAIFKFLNRNKRITITTILIQLFNMLQSFMDIIMDMKSQNIEEGIIATLIFIERRRSYFVSENYCRYYSFLRVFFFIWYTWRWP